MAKLTYDDLSNRSTLTCQRFLELHRKETEAFNHYKRIRDFDIALTNYLMGKKEITEEQFDMAMSWLNNSNVPIRDIISIVFEEESK